MGRVLQWSGMPKEKEDEPWGEPTVFEVVYWNRHSGVQVGNIICSTREAAERTVEAHNNTNPDEFCTVVQRILFTE